MTNYSIQIKKGEIQYSVSSGDKVFISGYIDYFFKSLNKYSKSYDEITMPKLIAEKTPSVTSEVIAQSQQAEEKTMNEMVKSLFDKSAEETIKNLDEKLRAKTKPEKEDLSDLGSLLTPKNNVHLEENIDTGNDYIFDSILEDKIKNPVFEEEPPAKIFDYDELLKSKQPESLTDYLIITAYYMLENENIETFQLKQLNAKLFNSMNMVVDRKTIQQAIEDGLLRVVSDGIQNDGAVEYALTQAGQEFYTNAHA